MQFDLDSSSISNRADDVRSVILVPVGSNSACTSQEHLLFSFLGWSVFGILHHEGDNVLILSTIAESSVVVFQLFVTQLKVTHRTVTAKQRLRHNLQSARVSHSFFSPASHSHFRALGVLSPVSEWARLILSSAAYSLRNKLITALCCSSNRSAIFWNTWMCTHFVHHIAWQMHCSMSSAGWDSEQRTVAPQRKAFSSTCTFDTSPQNIFSNSMSIYEIFRQSRSCSRMSPFSLSSYFL